MVNAEIIKHTANEFLSVKGMSILSDGEVDNLVDLVIVVLSVSVFEKPFRLGRSNTTAVLDASGKEVKRFNVKKQKARTKSLLLVALLNCDWPMK